MSYTTGGIVTTSDLINRFVSKIKNSVLSGSFVSTENPSPYVPYKVLGSYNELLETPSWPVGNGEYTMIKSGLSIGTVFGGLTYLTKLLLMVGSWSYLKEDRGRSSVSYSGKCIFNLSYVLKCFNVTSVDKLPINANATKVSYPQPIRYSSIESLYTDLLAKLNAAPKVQVSCVDSRCHENCHNNYTTTWHCHTDTYISCDCYTTGCYQNGPWVYGPLGSGHWNTSPQPAKHTDSGSSSNTCHDNYNRLSLTNPFGGCNTISL